MTPRAAAAVYGYAVAHIRRLCARGRLVAERVGGRWVIDENSMRRYVNESLRYHAVRAGTCHCGQPAVAYHLCMRHYQQQRRAGGAVFRFAARRPRRVLDPAIPTE